jgi:hypothetical protein
MTLEVQLEGRTVKLSPAVLVAVRAFADRHGVEEPELLPAMAARAARNAVRSYDSVRSAFFRNSNPHTFEALRHEEYFNGPVERLNLQLLRWGTNIMVYTLEELPPLEGYYERRVIEEAKLMRC